MADRKAHGEVKFKVRRNALLLGEFTISQLVRATGLNPESVRTEVQRLRKDGFLVSERKAGRREALYHLSDDPEKRLALSREVEDFYPEPQDAIRARPTSLLYQAALQSLDQAERQQGRGREALLKQATHQLEGAWQAEGASRAPELVQAHILRERGRVAYLQGQWEPATQLFLQAKYIFASAGLGAESRLVDEHLLCIEAQRQVAMSGAIDASAQARCVLDTLRAIQHPGIGPLARLLADLAGVLSQRVEDRVAEVTMKAELHREILGMRAEMSGMREDFRRLERKLPAASASLEERPWSPLSQMIQWQPEPGAGIRSDHPGRRLPRPETDD
jgi:DNA-binding transcriptional ArsR family regulator